MAYPIQIIVPINGISSVLLSVNRQIADCLQNGWIQSVANQSADWIL